ncbi:MAG: 4-hydroxythreonine-4-phosphate dehydrogenase PdxA [Geitlerinemataceae cyanobacterium]
MHSPKLAVSIGDPAGIGPEVILKALAALDREVRSAVTIVGDRSLLERTAEQLRDLDLDLESLKVVEPDLASDLDNIVPGVEGALGGAIGFAALNRAIDLCLDGICQGVVTAPISKTAWKAAGHHYPGQTELLAERAGVDRFGMLFVARSPHTGWVLRTLLATTHIPLAEVPTALTPELMHRKLDLAIETLQRQFGIDRPRIAISGLNPHSGENGQLGREELDWLNGWLAEARDRHPAAELTGLVPPDTLWVKPGHAWFGQRSAEKTAHDLYLALYHDQGLIPTKLLAFDLAVNTTIGLPFIRTSPDHGTAFDIAGRGIADPTSTIAAIELAREMAATSTGASSAATSARNVSLPLASSHR